MTPIRLFRGPEGTAELEGEFDPEKEREARKKQKRQLEMQKRAAQLI